MTLEDFFTLTEMKDGLTAPSRVEELVSVMQKEKNCVVKNIGDASRQWAAVASTIAATENKDCLDRFVQLDGLWFIDRWLKDAQKYDNDTSDTFVEESIMALLRALEKLDIDNERSISSGIWITVRNLLAHRSSQVQDRARALFDSWKQGRVRDTVHHDVESSGAHSGDGGAMLAAESSGPVCSSGDVSISKGGAGEDDHGAQPAEAEMLPSKSSEGLQRESADNLQIQTHENELISQTNLDQEKAENTSPHHLASFVLLNSVKEDTSMMEKSPPKTVDNIETCNFPVSEQSSIDGQSEAPKLNEFSKDEKQVQKLSNSPEKVGLTASNLVKVGAVSHGADGICTQENVMEPALKNNFDVNDSDSYIRSAALGNVGMPATEPKTETGDTGVTSHCSPQVLKIGQVGEFHSDTLQESSLNERICEKPDCLETSFSRAEDVGAADDDKEQTSDEGEDFGIGSGFSKPIISTRSPDPIDKRRSDIELDYGMDDALEVARKVAQEVEREVVHYREPSCSSSEKISEGESRQPNSPDSINGKDDLPTEDQPKETPAGKNISAEENPKEGHFINAENPKSGPENSINDMEFSQVTEAAQEPEVNTEKSLCDFDLNQEVSSEDMDHHPVNSALAPISVVSASRPTVTPGLPAAPLQFEGTLGWKGSAATSAFRPASPRRISDSGKTLSIGGTSDMPNKRVDRFDFDLNVAEGGDEKPADLISGKHIPVSSGLRSTESSLDVSPRRLERPNLDLNRISDDGDAPPSDLRIDGGLFFNRNGHRSPSPASSSSSMQPSLRNIDLNDRPYFYNDSADQGLHQGKSSQNLSALGGIRQDEPVISIMGARVEVNRRDFIPRASPLPNGKALEPASDAHMARTGGFLGMGPSVSYSHSPVFGYNGLTPTPAMPFSTAMYGPGGSVPYMLDSRVAPVVPQLGSGSAVAPSYSQPPFIMNLAAGPSGLNGAGPSRPSLDLNSGFAIEGGGNRDSVGLRQLFMPGQGRSFEEQLRANSQPSSSSGVGLKRKEPDSGWEPYPFNYRPQPPWN